MTIPDEAVQAALNEYCNCDTDGELDPMRAALTAALPFLQGVKVKALEWEEAAKIAEGSSGNFDHQSALAECRDCESGFHHGRVAAASAIRALSSQPVADGCRYRLIEDGEAIEEADEFIEDDAVNWTSVTVNRWVIGMKYNRSLKAVRRPLPASPGASATRPTGGSVD